MARYLGPSCRLCRREGEKLYLKGERCFSDKCAVDKRKTAPGQHGRRSKLSDYGVQLREKQKLKRIFSMLEKPFRAVFERVAASKKGKTGDMLLQNLETRLDSVVYHMGLGINRRSAHQIVRHSHILVNGRMCNIPSRRMKAGDTVTLKPSAQSIPTVVLAMETSRREGHGIPTWLSWDGPTLTGTVVHLPSREEIHLPVKEQLVVELYSK